MNLVWKLLRQHISIPQFAGFAFANLFGMLIVLSASSLSGRAACLHSGRQFHESRLPHHEQEDRYGKYHQRPFQYLLGF